jgi:NAD(P)-dependent dehydrogenase (short-subunit alcohol dehydrogenase family)
MKISEQVAFVTGANRGFGRHLALELLSRGAKVYAGARNPESIDIPGVIPVKLDITNPQEVAAAAIVAKDVTLLINNAGSSTGASLIDGEFDKIHLEFNTHFFVLGTSAPGTRARDQEGTRFLEQRHGPAGDRTVTLQCPNQARPSGQRVGGVSERTDERRSRTYVRPLPSM